MASSHQAATTSYGGGGSGSNSVTDVLDRVIGLSRDNNNSETNNDAFIASDKWRGVKQGYVFRTSPEFGTGYHLDDITTHPHQQREQLLHPKSGSINSSSIGNGEASGRETKRARFDTSRDITHAIPARPSSKLLLLHNDNEQEGGRAMTTGEELLAQAEASLLSSQQQQQQQQQQPFSSPNTKLLELTTRGIQSAAASLEKTKQRNSLLRAQHECEPEKYMMEELALHDEIMNFRNAAVDLSCYEAMVRCGVITDSFLELMNHDNVDVALCVVSVMVELLDPDLMLSQEDAPADRIGEEEDGNGTTIDPMEKARKNMALLANSFVNGGGVELISSNLGRLDESVEEEAKGVEDILTLVETLLDLDRMGVLLTSNDKKNNSNGNDDEDNDDSRSSSIVMSICQQTTFLSWLFQRIENSNSSNNETDSAAAAAAPNSPAVLKLHTSEVLSAILQHEDYSMHRCGEKIAALPKYTSVFHDTTEDKVERDTQQPPKNNSTTIDGMEILLLAIAEYRKSDPQIEVECEFLENIFDALAASLLREENVTDFVEAEGIELMLRCLRQNVHAGGGALKVLNFALSASSALDEASNPKGEVNAYRKACETFVHAGGLKIIFPLYMGRKSAIPCPAACSDGGSDLAKRINKNGSVGGAAVVSKRAKRAAQARKQWLVEVEQNTIHIVYALTRHIAKESQYDAHARLLVKFLEEDCEKCDRTIELCLKYDEKARIAEYQYFRSDEAEEAEKLGINVETAALGAKLRGGGDMFHRTCAILSFACVGSKRCHAHSLDQVKLQGSGISVIKDGLIEFASLLRDGHQKSQIEHYITSI